MTMVPPTHSPAIIMVDHMAVKDSPADRVDTIQKVVREMSRDRARMEYLFFVGVENRRRSECACEGGLVEMHEKPHISYAAFFRRRR